MNQEGEREFLAITEQEIWEEARDRLQIAVEDESGNRTKAKYDLEFVEGLNHWDQKQVNSASMEEPELTINLTDALVRRVVNNMKQQRPRGKCHPVGDGADVEKAEVINGLGRHIEYRSEAGVAYDTAGEMAAKIGWGYWRLIIEYVAPDSFERDIRILPIRNVFTVYMDPAAIMPTACDANWCLITIKMPRTEYKRLYPRAENTAWNDIGRNEDRNDWEDKEEIRLAEYFRIREKTEKLYSLTDHTGAEYSRFESEMPAEESLKLAGLTITDERESSKRQVEWFRLNGRKVVQREILPGEWIPVIRCEGNAVDVDGKIMRRGMVRAMIDAQRMVDYSETAKIKRLGLSSQAKWLVAEGQTDGRPEWDTANTQAYPVLTYKPQTIQTDQGEIPVPPPQQLPPAQVEAGFAEFTNGMRSNLLAIAGMPNDPGQDMTGQVVSGRALQRRQKLSDQSHFQFYDNQTLAIAHTWRIIVQWVKEVYPEPGRLQRIIGEDGIPEMIKLNEKAENAVKNDVTVGRYDIVMDTGPGYDTKREEGSETLLGLIQAPAIAQVLMNIAPDLIFRSIDHPYMQEIADRFSAMTPEGLKQVMAELPERAKSIVQSLSNQLAQAKQQLQQAQSGITKAHLAATVKAHDVEESNKTKRFDTVAREHGALAREEVRAGVELLGKHMDHAQAERMIETGEADGASGTGQQ